MPELTNLHNEAMNLAEKALRMEGDEALKLKREVFKKEKRVALALLDEPEPLRSIMLRSTATLAIRAQEPEEAENLIKEALKGNPCEGMKLELEDLLTDAQNIAIQKQAK
ncbi:MAG: hypothetical protein GX221_11225 [Candidatus Riflebacteria bacterium]|nr:hypothetical protein [Candidatus Riflebacteria bacterium]